MRGNFLIALFVSLCFVACARPKYINVVNPSEANTGNNSSQNDNSKAEEQCSLQFKVQSLCFVWQWEQKPTDKTPGSLVFKTFRQSQFDGTPIETDLEMTPSVLLWMPSMGHGSVPTKVEKIEQGTYRASRVFFIMPGEWDIHFQLKNDQGLQDEIVIPVII